MTYLSECKRTTVWAFAATENEKGWYALHTARNGNEGECTNVVGNCTCVHAEINLLDGMTEEQLDQTTLVIVTYSPCEICAMSLVTWLPNLKRVHYLEENPQKNGLDYLKNKGIQTIQTKMTGTTMEYEVESYEKELG